jgi:U3 small nucleolar RNA-associated protein 7
MIIFLF